MTTISEMAPDLFRISTFVPDFNLQFNQFHQVFNLAVSFVQIKIEVTPVLRGCVYPPEKRSVRERVEDAFGYAEIAVVSFPDLYAGKIVAALDRQSTTPMDSLAYKFDIVLRGRRSTLFENKPEGN